MNPDDMRDALVRAAPDHAGLVLSRDQVIEHWCQTHGKNKNDLSMSDILTIRALPEWKNAG